MYVSAGVFGGQKRMLNFPGAEVSGTQVFCKSSKCCQSLSQLSRPGLVLNEVLNTVSIRRACFVGTVGVFIH